VIYLDTSALVKLVVVEQETAVLRAWLDERAQEGTATSEIARVELPRAVMRAQPAALLLAHRILAKMQTVGLSRQTLDVAASLQPPGLRSLDAVHLASALAIRGALTSFVAYDKRLLDAATAVGLPAIRPGV
jgi:predicted nucleic acid-binding protein